jgi:hypothetical protein
MKSISCATVHNTRDAIAVGCAASAHLKQGAIQIINTQPAHTANNSSNRTTFNVTTTKEAQQHAIIQQQQQQAQLNNS